MGWRLGFSVFIAAVGFLAFAQQEEVSSRYPKMREGEIFTINLTPGSKKLVISFTGKPHIELGPERILVFGREILPGGKVRDLKIKPVGEGFEILEPTSLKKTLEIEVHDKTSDGKKEVIKLEPK